MKKLLEPEGDLQQENRIKKEKKILQGTTTPAITYGAQTWALTRNQEEKLGAVQRNIGRKKNCWNKMRKKISNEKLKEITEGRDMGYITKKLKLGYAGHVAREKEQKWGEYSLSGYLDITRDEKEGQQKEGR